VSDVSRVQSEDAQLREYAERLWASDDYRAWREHVRRAVADGTIYDEPPLNGATPTGQ
jgi:hypothetical protein